MKATRHSSITTTVLALLVGIVRPAAGDETRFVNSADGVRIAYEVRGTGSPALVFVHGWSCDRSYWSAQLPPFSRDHQVVAIDLAGHGESGLDREAWTIAAFGDDVAAVVDKLGLERVVLIGHSMGGDVVVEAVRRLPGRVAGLIWVDSYADLDGPRAPGPVDEFLAPFRADFVETTRGLVRGMFPPAADPQLVARVADDMSSAPPAIALGALASAFGYYHELIPVLRQLDLPVVAINAGYRPTDVESLQRHGVEAVTLPGVGHFLMMEDPERFNALLNEVTDRFER